MNGHQILDQLSHRDRLLFSQAVYELGSNAWPDVSKLLEQHPLIQLPRAVLAPQVSLTAFQPLVALIERVQSCAKIYKALIDDLPSNTCVTWDKRPR